MSFFLDEDKATIVSPDEYATGNKTNYQENLAASWNYIKQTSFSISERYNLINKYAEVVDVASTLGHTDLINPFIEDTNPMNMGEIDPILDRQKFAAQENETLLNPDLDTRLLQFHEMLDKKQNEDINLKKALADKGLDSQESIQKQIGIDAQESFKKYSDINSRATAYGKLGGYVGQAGVVFDPILVATLPIGFAYSVPRNFFAAAGKIAMIESILAGTAETAIQYGYVGEYRKELGFEDPNVQVFGLNLSPEQQKIGLATLGAAIGGPALLGLFKSLGKGFELTGDGLKIIRDKLDELPTHRIKRMYNEVIQKNPKLKSEAAEVTSKSTILEDDNPFKDTPVNNKEFDERIDEMADVVLRDKKPNKILEQPTAEIDIKLLDNYKSTVRTLDPDEIEFKPDEFQYKTDGDVFGVTEKLKQVQVWDQPSAGTLLIYEFAPKTEFKVGDVIRIDNKGTTAKITRQGFFDKTDMEKGQYFVETTDGKKGKITLEKLKEFNKSIKAVVDGHQRLGLAKRLKAQGQDVKIIAHVFKEIDDIPKEMMLVKGMLINLRNNTGTAVDAARVLRTAGKLDWEKIKQTLPLKQKLVRNADGLSRLSDDAWGLFLNKRIDEDLAARIGLKIENKAIHNKLLAALSSRKFSSLQEIDTVLDQIKRTPTVKAEQETLFGKEFFEETLIFEKTALIKYVSQNSKKLKDVFKTVLANEKDLSSAGNVLNKSENLQRGIDNEKIYERLSAVATQTGRLSDDFNNAAGVLKQGNTKEARRLAEEAVRRAVAEGDFDRFSAGGLQRTNEVETASSSISKEPPIEKIDLTEDLKHKDIKENPQVVEQQIEDLNRNLFGEQEPKVKTETPLNLDEERLIDEIKNTIKSAEITDAKVNEYLNHPLLKKKFEDGQPLLKYTNQEPGYGTDQFWQTRKYSDDVIGLESFVNKIYGEGAAIKDKKFTIVMGPSAAGKSTFVDDLKAKNGSMVTDSDDVKALMPEYANGANADGVHLESSVINAKVLNKGFANGDNIIYPTTGRDSNKLNLIIKMAEQNGYEVKVKLITADRKELILRNITRTFTKNRLIDSNKLLSEDVVKGIENNYNALNEKYKIGKIDNTTGNSSGQTFESDERGGQSLYRSLDHEVEVGGYSRDIVANFSKEDRIPDRTIVNTETGELENTTITIKELLERERQDETFLERLKDCV